MVFRIGGYLDTSGTISNKAAIARVTDKIVW